MARRNPRRRLRGDHEEEHENDERWLLTYADMITLLMALFIVMFSAAVMNTSKFDALSMSLKDAFTSNVLSGGSSVQSAGAGASSRILTPKDAATAAVTSTQTRTEESLRRLAELQENSEFARLKRSVDAYAASHGLSGKLESAVTRRGLRIRLLTDRLVFTSGDATLRPAARPLLLKLGGLLRTSGGGRPIQVDGHTDDVPVHSGAFADNWDLSAARATTVVRELIADGVAARRLGAGGFGYHHPIATNATADGRARNRRVEILLTRRQLTTQGGTR